MRTLFLLVLVASCGGQPKQAEAPDVDKGSGVDMAGDEPAAAPKPNGTSTKEPESDMQKKCCDLCKQGMAKDRTGQPAAKVPCSDFTDVMTPWCLEHFRAHPSMAASCP
jgi:hypothetical protein